MFDRLGRSLTAAFLLALPTGAALADGMPGSRTYGGVTEVRPYTWSGFYLGLQAGGAWSEDTWTTFNGGASGSVKADDSSYLVGGQAGIMGQWGRFVAGVEVSYAGVKLENQGNITGGGAEFRVKDLLLATGRLGYAFDRSLIYAKGGWANAEVEANVFTGATLSGTSGGRESGWTVGGGWDYAITRSVSIGVEYNYIRLDVDDRTYKLEPGFSCSPTCGSRDVDPTIQTVALRLNFKIGDDSAYAPLK